MYYRIFINLREELRLFLRWTKNKKNQKYKTPKKAQM